MSDPTSNSIARLGVGIRYIGNKPKKTDNVAGSDTIWQGFGDVQDVPATVAAKLLAPKYRDIWQNENDKPPEQIDRSVKMLSNVQGAVAAARAKAEARTTPRPNKPESFDKVEPEAVLDAIADLAEAKQTDAFDANGQPLLPAIRAKLGKNISQEALTEAWNILMSSRA